MADGTELTPEQWEAMMAEVMELAELEKEPTPSEDSAKS